MISASQGMVYSFWRLLEEQRIEIPIIQRDYAQGRKDKKEIRKDFLNALHKSLDKEKPIKLDFIYGSKSRDIFQPLDGQQRLTTLFLLHWYAALKDSMLDEDIKQVLLKFSYETRASSREFCNELVRRSIVIGSDSESIRDIIVNSSWFFLSWEKDPTIDAMLRVIDDIHKVFHDLDNLWTKLLSDNVLISFYHVELENFGLTDDLYIKMNARGKLLTPFENFKALFQKRIDDNEWDSEKSFLESFAYKVDTNWTDLFWAHRKNDRIDASFIRFISTVAMVQFSLERSEDRVENLAKLHGQPDAVKFDHFTKEGYEYLCECLDAYCRVFDENLLVELDIPFWQHKPDGNIFTALVYEGNTSASYTQKVLFYAQTEYLLNISEFNKESFQSWMRVIRNIVSRGDAEKTGNRPTIIRSPDTFIGVINLIKELSEGCNDIYEFLSTQSIKSSFAKEQVEEEKLKSKLIMNSDINKEVVFSTEDTNFCQGKIQFALYCIDYNKEEDDFSLEKLKNILNVIKTYLEEEKISNNFRRGLLTISVDGAYNYYDYWWSWSGAVNANKRCLIARYRELEYYIYGTKNSGVYKKYLKKLFLQLTDKSLENIILDFIAPKDMPNWKVRLIKEPQLLDEKCKSNYIAIPEDGKSCYLLKIGRAHV